MKKPLCLVTGACGFMGSHMIQTLHKAGYPIRAPDLPHMYENDDRKAGRFPSVIKDLSVEFVPADLTDASAAPDLVADVGLIFHIAGLFKYSATWEALREVNEDGTRNLLDAALDTGKMKRFIMWGAGGVYGFPTLDQLPLTEDMETNPPNNYLKSKDLAEKVVMQTCSENKIPHAVLRPTSVYGPRGVYGGGEMIMQLATMNPLVVPTNLTGRVPFIHVSDVVGSALHLAEHDGEVSGAYNVNDDSQMTQVEMMRFFSLLTGHTLIKLPPIPIEFIRASLGTVADLLQHVARDMLNMKSPVEADMVRFFGQDLIYSNEKLKATGYQFIYPDARHGLRDAVLWYRENGWI